MLLIPYIFTHQLFLQMLNLPSNATMDNRKFVFIAVLHNKCEMVRKNETVNWLHHCRWHH